MPLGSGSRPTSSDDYRENVNILGLIKFLDFAVFKHLDA